MLNIGVCGSQIVGLVPLKPLLMAAEYYIEKENLFILDEDQKIRLVIQRLGLNSIAPFNPKERIIEYIIRDREGHDDGVNSMEIKELIKHIGMLYNDLQQNKKKMAHLVLKYQQQKKVIE